MQNLKLQFKIKNYVVLIFLPCIGLVLPLIGQAAELYLETSENQYYTNETFVADVRINVEHNESINAVEGYVKFPNDILEIKDFSTGNSILTFIEEPKIYQEQGLISFIGIIPGGYSGMIPGDTGKSNLLGRIVLRTIHKTTQNGTRNYAKIEFLENSQVLLSDGKGTPAKLITKGVTIEVEPPVEVQPQEVSRDEWQEELKKDKIPPEDFKAEIIKINDRYYLAFTTKDKGSGIAYYVIHETSQKKEIARINTKEWIEVESPYLLKDQKLSSYVYIKAVDKAGNERVVVVEPFYPIRWYEKWQIWFIIITGVIIFYSVIRIPWKKYTKQQ